MSYFIFSKNTENITGSLYRIAENLQDLNNIIKVEFQTNYTIIEDTQQNFEDVVLSKKTVISYNNNNIFYDTVPLKFYKEEELQNYINNLKLQIKSFLENNSNHIYFNKWNNYLNQLNQFSLSNFTFPLNQSLEQYFKDQNKPFLNPLQLP